MTYASTVHVAPATIASGIARLLERVRTAAAEAHRRSVVRRQCRQFLAVEDHLLKDIGVCRDEVRQAMRAL